MEAVLSNPFFHALLTEHAHFSVGSGLARRYPADIIPFAGLREASSEAETALADLLLPGEDVYVVGHSPPTTPDLIHVREIPGWQMHVSTQGDGPSISERPKTVNIRALGAEDAPAMVALTTKAFPGFFRTGTYKLGRYYGIHAVGVLVAMAGERLALPGYRELSAVCTHPDHTGKGYAALLVNHLLQVHSDAGLRSFLHVAVANVRAISLYKRLGFVKTRSVMFQQLRRA